MFREDLIKHKSVEAYFTWVLEELGESDYWINIKQGYSSGYLIINYKLNKITMRDILKFAGLKYVDGELGYEGKTQVLILDKLDQLVDKDAEKLYLEDSERRKQSWLEYCEKLLQESDDYSKYERYNQLKEIQAEIEDGTEVYNIKVEFGNGLILELNSDNLEYETRSEIEYLVDTELKEYYPDINYGKPSKSELWNGKLLDLHLLSYTCGITLEKGKNFN